MAHPPVRTFRARKGRVGPTTRAAVEALRPRFGLPDGPLPAGRPVVLEVGCGHGGAAHAYAAAHADRLLVAADVHRAGTATLLQRLAAEPLPNLLVHEGDAVDLLAERCTTAGLAGVHLFFPDPWPKARHAGRRFVRPDLLDLVADRLAPGGSLLVATDDAAYAEAAEALLAAHPAFAAGRSPRPSWRPLEGYEAKAVAARSPVVDLRATRLGGPADA